MQSRIFIFAVFGMLVFPALLRAHDNIESRPQGFVESRPSDIGSYIRAGRTPKYLRINVSGYNIRGTPQFEINRTNNLRFKSNAGSLFAVSRMQPLTSGVAVAIFVDGKEHWVFVPYYRKADFQFCESEACFQDLAESLELLLVGANLTSRQAMDCGVKNGPDGFALPDIESIAPPKSVAVSPARLPPPVRAPAELSALASQIPPQNRPVPLKTLPLWELKHPVTGAQWTRMLQGSLSRYGQQLLGSRQLEDAHKVCPKFSSPSFTEQDREEFWIHVINGIARYESGFNPRGVFDEASHTNVFNGPINPRTYSMGALQLSYESAQYYRPACRFSWAQDQNKSVSDPSLTIYDMQKHLDCAVGILNHWVGKHGSVTPGRGENHFWTTLSPANPASQRVIASLRRFGPCWQ